MKIKVFENINFYEQGRLINEFIKDKIIIDVKLTSYGYAGQFSSYSKIILVILYEDSIPLVSSGEKSIPEVSAVKKVSNEK